MFQELQKQFEHQLPAFADPSRRWVGSIVLAIALGIAYFLAARLSLDLLTKPDGVAVFWPAAGVATGILMALGPGARLPVAAGAMAATIVANLLGDRNVLSAIVFALCNAGEAVLVAGVIEFYFGSSFSLGSLRDVLGLLAAAILGTAVSGIGGTVGYVLFHSSTTPVLTIWSHWFASDALGIVTVAPLLIGLVSAARDPPPRNEVIEGAVALGALSFSVRRHYFLAAAVLGSRGTHRRVFPAAAMARGPLQTGLCGGSRIYRCLYNRLGDDIRHWHVR